MLVPAAEASQRAGRFSEALERVGLSQAEKSRPDSRLGKYHEYVSGKVSRKRREFGLELRSPQHRGVVRIKLQMRCLVSGSPDCCAKGFQSQNLRAGRGRQSYRVHQHCEGDWDCRPQFPSSGGVPAGV